MLWRQAEQNPDFAFSMEQLLFTLCPRRLSLLILKTIESLQRYFMVTWFSVDLYLNNAESIQITSHDIYKL